MKLRLWLTAWRGGFVFALMKLINLNTRHLLGAAFVAFAVSWTQPVSASDKDDQTELGKAMEEGAIALKSLRKIDKSDWAGAAKAARAAADGMRKSMPHVPVLVQRMPEGKEKAKAVADYKRVMGEVYAALCELELAYLDEDSAKVEAAMGKIKALKKEGHKKYEDD